MNRMKKGNGAVTHPWANDINDMFRFYYTTTTTVFIAEHRMTSNFFDICECYACVYETIKNRQMEGAKITTSAVLYQFMYICL